jgi:hypothetical protein
MSLLRDKPGPCVDVIHHIECRHRIEVEVSPPRAELYFADERWTDRIDTQIRFEATVFNSDRGVHWQVYAADGGTGAGSIDATGLYRAPAKGSLTSGHTDVVVATSVEDPLRKAYAWVTVVGEGPLPTPQPRIEIWPKRASLYYGGWYDNAYIDDSNKQQLFRATLWHSADQTVEWLVDGSLQLAQPNVMAQSFVYEAPGSGPDQQPKIVRVRIKSNPGVYDEAQLVLLNYVWPGLH